MSSSISGRWRLNLRNPFFYAALFGAGCTGVAGMLLAGADVATALLLFGPILVLLWVTMPFLIPPAPADIDHRVLRLVTLAGWGVVLLVVALVVTRL
ncbi:hypothetical protein [Nocardioides coralli]|uniref:hypothetical protein n=1 Tax=Nocardioides coralli TaxID=2872154 RepID=UPI001CA3BA76|nr:hypothetical protein [Nocardioides coralli]QZY28570.1 hypothetical protein K6T13_14035 [Nocardioides coralli]